MSALPRILGWLYAQSLKLYPAKFRANFSEEMQSVFAEVVTDKSRRESILLFLRELGDLPGSLLNAYAIQRFLGENMPTQNEYISPSTRWQAFIGVLPFLAFGIVSMIGKVDHLYGFQVTYFYLAFYILTLSGLLIGWVRGFPLWSYGYLGWSLLGAWWWSNARINGVYWGYRVWALFGGVILIAFIWTRSLGPIKKFFRDIWNDWTRLSLVMYTFVAFVWLIYDENHHPYLLIFMSASTLAIAAGAWFFLRSASLKARVASIVGGLIAGNVIGQICDNTWDAAAYYDLPAGLPSPWYMTVFRTFMILSFFAVFLFWPAVISLYQRTIRSRMAN